MGPFGDDIIQIKLGILIEIRIILMYFENNSFFSFC